MTPERWQQVARVYESALEQAPANRAAFLADACHGDSDLRREVESLLAREDARVLVDQPVGMAAAAVLGSIPGIAPGTSIGPYWVTALLGEGGMGQVYRAHDTKLQRDVALKILPDAFVHDRDRVARFTREAQVLASLNHPNIGAIYGFEDSGAVTRWCWSSSKARRWRIASRAAHCRWTRRLRLRGRLPKRWRQRTSTASSIATSSRPTSRCGTTGR